MTIALVLRATLLLLAGLALYAVTARRSAALRHAVLTATLTSLLVLPFAVPLAPRRLPLPIHAAPAPIRTFAVQVNRGAAVVAGEHERSLSPRTALTFCWAFGVALFALRLAASWRAALRLRAAARRSGTRVLLHGREVLLTDDVDAPLTIGLLKPVILMPVSMASCNAALLHEAAHIARGDAWWRLAAEVTRAIYWFHPLVWIVSRFAALEQERACDDAALDAGVGSLDYAELLVGVASRAGRSAALPMAAARQLEARLRSLVDPARPRRPLGWRGASAAFVGAAALLGVTAAVTVVAAAPAAAYAAPISDRFQGPYDDPVVEALPDVAVYAAPDVVAAERPLAAALEALARRPKTWPGDLVAQRARWPLSRSRDGRLVEPLREALDDPDWRVRAYAAWNLAIVRDRQSVPRLQALLADPVWRMRAMAAHALEAAGDDRSAAAMERALSDEAWQVREEATHYFAARTDARSHALVASMTNDPHIAVRTAANRE
ncbi:MAG TPA: M56 family metallopeptidase [Thermoanaerobaculia bacterium]|nr:M56 family metallopeptidase [Thermoanaerobaculia bacterium]